MNKELFKLFAEMYNCGWELDEFERMDNMYNYKFSFYDKNYCILYIEKKENPYSFYSPEMNFCESYSCIKNLSLRIREIYEKEFDN